MKTIKVIDLFNKIANGEEVPNHIRYEGIDLYYNKKNNCYDLIMSNVREEFYTFSYSDLNNEVEIIEDTPKEDKKIEKLEGSCDMTTSEICRMNNIEVKINEIIDRLNGENNELTNNEENK